MKIYTDPKELKNTFQNTVLTIGNFDGVHLGHQALFKKVVNLAEQNGGDKLAVTFRPHPLKVLRPDNPPKLISRFEHKIELIEKSGIETVVALPFTRELASTTAEDFVKSLLVDTFNVRELVIGYDYACGKGRKGDIPFLINAGEKYNFNVHVVPKVMVGDMVASSTNIRKLVAEGEMRKVASLLGRYYQFRGVVREGLKRGGPVVGFPTANLKINPEDLCPLTGVYAVQVIHDSICYGGVINIGYNPTFGDQGLGAEVHIFDFNKDIYGHPIKVNMIQRIRPEKKFESVEELSKQIANDVETAKKILENEPGLSTACKHG
jgi:riboflavin kinase/FMN adenylyltransferase